MNNQIKVIPYVTAILLFCSILLFHPSFTSNANAKEMDYVYVKEHSITMQIGDTHCLHGFTLSGKAPKFKSSKSSVASVNSDGIITAKKAGSTRITVKVSGHEDYCTVTVKPTVITLNKNSMTLYRDRYIFLRATTSTGHTPVFRSSRSSVATVDENGLIHTKKNGTAIIRVTCDKTTVQCTITVLKPEIDLSNSSLTLHVGESKQITATVSSRNPVVWSVSNSNVISVDASGTVQALHVGKAYLYAKEDGTKVSCVVRVISD
ncbi:Ig-like domain (group 2) [Lachnospiraceae bacterium XBB1006]|nr:Ig-like domain (group 2) [Lachnospiraceae bacterium XBB1006]